MRVLQFVSKTFATELADFCRGAVIPKEIQDSVSAILADVRARGDEAVAYYAAKFDGAKLRAREFRVKPAEIAAAVKRLPAADKKALAAAHENILAFNKKPCPTTGAAKTNTEPPSASGFIPSAASASTSPAAKCRSSPPSS